MKNNIISKQEKRTMILSATFITVLGIICLVLGLHLPLILVGGLHIAALITLLMIGTCGTLLGVFLTVYSFLIETREE